MISLTDICGGMVDSEGELNGRVPKTLRHGELKYLLVRKTVGLRGFYPRTRDVRF